MLKYLLIFLNCFSLAVAQVPSTEGPTTKKAVVEMTDALGEEAFKKLHELKGGSLPDLSGIMVKTSAGAAYLSLPAGAVKPRAGILVLHEWWGLNAHIKHCCDRLAAAGYAALAVDLYSGNVATSRDDAMKFMRAANADPEGQAACLAAGLEFLRQDKRVEAKKVASLGWCFGGGRSLEVALNHSDLDAAVIYYGRLVLDAAQLQKIKGKVLGIFAVRDQGIPIAAVSEFERALLEAGVSHEIHRYNADHAFANPSSARYQESAAAAAWSEVRRFLKRSLAD